MIDLKTFHMGFNRVLDTLKVVIQISKWILTSYEKTLIQWMLVRQNSQVLVGEQALGDFMDLLKGAWTCWGCFYTQQWADAEDGEGIRSVAGTRNE